MGWVNINDKRPIQHSPSKRYLVVYYLSGKYMNVDIDFFYEGRFTKYERGQYSVKYWHELPELPEGLSYE